MKQADWILYLLLTGVLFFLFLDPLSHVVTYHEQHTLFLFSPSYVQTYFMQPGMSGQGLADFIIQFFYLPYFGRFLFALILSSSLALITICSRKLVNGYDYLLTGLLPVCYLLIRYESVDFPVYHSVSLLFALLLLLPFSYLPGKWKGVYLMVYFPVTIWLLGWLYPLIACGLISLSGLSAYLFKHYIRRFHAGILLPMLLLYTGVSFVQFVRHYNMRERLLVDAEQSLQQQDWEQVLQIAGRYRGNHPLMTYFRNLALYHSGGLGERLFDFPQPYGVESLYLPWRGEARLTLFGHYLYEHLGYLNEAHRWAFESLEVFGETAPVLTRLIRYNIANDRPEVALKFIRLLKQSLFYKKDAVYYEQLVTHGKKEPLYILPHVQDEPPRFANILQLAPELLFVLKRDPANRMAFEYLMSCFLLTNQVGRLVEYLPAIHALEDPRLPRLYEEALCLYQERVGEDLFSHIGFTISASVKKRRQHFSTLLNAGDHARLKTEFGNSYWYYVSFQSPYGNTLNIE